MPNPKVFFKYSKKGVCLGDLVIELFTDTTPRMAGNFRLLCTGEKSRGLHYKGFIFVYDKDNRTYHVKGCIPKVYEQQLDLSVEYSIKEHKVPGSGSVLMLPGQTDFYISVGSTLGGVLDNRCMVVGQVVEGLFGIVRFTTDNYYLAISDCGQLPEPKLSKKPGGEAVGMMSNSNKQLSDILKEMKKEKDQLAKVDASKEHFGDLDEMEKYVRCNLDVLNDLVAETTCLKGQYSEMARRISKLKEGKVILKAIPSLSDEVLDDIVSAIKKLKTDRPR